MRSTTSRCASSLAHSPSRLLSSSMRPRLSSSSTRRSREASARHRPLRGKQVSFGLDRESYASDPPADSTSGCDGHHDRFQIRPHENSLRSRVFRAALLRRNESLHAIAERCTAQVHLTYQVLPRIVRSTPPVGHVTPIRFMGTRPIQPELIERPIDIEPRRGRLQPGRRAIVAPFVIVGERHGMAAHGIQPDVANQFEEMPCAFGENALETDGPLGDAAR
jgi:hypothetical protein